MNATADVPSSRLKNYHGGGDRKDCSLFAARLAAILLIVLITAAAAFLALPVRSLVRFSASASASASASSSHVLWLFVVVIAAAIWILHHAAAPPHRDDLHFASGWTAQLWHDDEIHLPTMSEYYYYDNDVNATSESAFKVEATRKNTRVMEPPKEEEEGEDDKSMEETWKAIVGRRGARKSEERVENSTKGDAKHLPRKVVYKEGGGREKKKAAVAAEGWRKRELAVAVANDELFHRVETFIKKHYDHLRLQQQESEQRRLLEMFRHRGRS